MFLCFLYSKKELYTQMTHACYALCMRARHPFTIYKRHLKIGTVYYYCAYDENNKRIRASTGKLNKKEAHAYCMELHKRGCLIPQQKRLLYEYAEPFFTEKCRYVKRREAWAQRTLSNKYLITMRSKIVLLLKNLPNVSLDKIRSIDVESAMNTLTNTHKVKTINEALSVLSIMFEEAIRENLINHNPCKQVARMHQCKSEKGILSLNEVKHLFSIVWDDEQMKMFNLVASLTGMRRGQLLALHVRDVHDGHVHVCNAYASGDGLKDRTKTGINRFVPLPKSICIALRAEKQAEELVFQGVSHNGIVPENKPTQELYKALKKIGINEAERQKRNITLHSWRHFFNTFCRSAGVPDSKLQAVTGHLTDAMTDHYTHFNPSDFGEVAQVQEKMLTS